MPVEATKPAARKVISVPGKITIKQSAPQAVKAAAVTPVKQAAPVVTPLKSSRGSVAVLRDSHRPADDESGGDDYGGVYLTEAEAARHLWR